MESDLESEAESVDSVIIDEVIEMVLETESDGKRGRLCYLCRAADYEEVFDRSDLMDGGPQQKLVLQFERKHPPPWDEVCMHCDGDGCEECECPDCDRLCRFIDGTNYGCPRHPVV